VVKDVSLKILNKKILACKAPQILIAGCGTGQHAIDVASRFKNCDVVAVDLSLRSLAYAKRQARDLGILNIEFIQADILDLAKLRRQFDIVESLGVLHHMEEPLVGWRVLVDCLRDNGLMKISLYSELARKHVDQLRLEIKNKNIANDNVGIKFFRTKLIDNADENLKNILLAPDFFSMSSLRDLLFHVQENSFRLIQIEKILANLKLEFCGFDFVISNPIVNKFKLSNHGSDDIYDLNKWNIFEEENPNTFSETDGFWCQKNL